MYLNQSVQIENTLLTLTFDLDLDIHLLNAKYLANVIAYLMTLTFDLHLHPPKVKQFEFSSCKHCTNCHSNRTVPSQDILQRSFIAYNVTLTFDLDLHPLKVYQLKVTSQTPTTPSVIQFGLNKVQISC